MADATEIAEHLQAIRQALRQSIVADAQQFRVPLSGPQLHALRVLVEEQRTSSRGLSLSQLSQRMMLAHSTVSGIVSRLEDRNLIRRTVRPEDRRFVSIELTEAVKKWLEVELPTSRLDPLERAISDASAKDRKSILNGLATLRRLLTVAESTSDREGELT